MPGVLNQGRLFPDTKETVMSLVTAFKTLYIKPTVKLEFPF